MKSLHRRLQQTRVRRGGQRWKPILERCETRELLSGLTVIFEQEGAAPIVVEDNGPLDSNLVEGTINVAGVPQLPGFTIEGYTISVVRDVPGGYAISQSGTINRRFAAGDELVSMSITVIDTRITSVIPETLFANTSALITGQQSEATLTVTLEETPPFVLGPLVPSDPPPSVILDPQEVSAPVPFEIQTRFDLTLGPTDTGLRAQFLPNASVTILGAALNPAINIEKSTNGQDADIGPGPILAVGDTANFTYLVTNTGNVPLANIVVTDDQGLTPVFVSGDTNGNGLLDLNETWTYTASTIVTAGQYTNIGTAMGTSPDDQVVNDTDPSNHFGAAPAVTIQKLTNGQDADVGPGPILAVGSTATFTYLVTNTGNLPLSNVVVTDDQGLTPVFVNGDTNGNGLLDLNETWTYTASTIVTAGQYTNIGTVVGTPTQPDGTPIPTPGLPPVSDNDPSNHFGAAPDVNIVKLTNGTNNQTGTGPLIPVGNTVTWTYNVTNTGNVPLSNVVVTDDQGVVPVFVNGDTNGNGLLDLTETWTYTATGTAIAGQYVNLGTVNATSPINQPVNSSDPDRYFGAAPRINILKLTGDKVGEGEDADVGPGPFIPVGNAVVFTYLVTNTGNVPLTGIVVTDDQGLTPLFVSGDTNGNGLLDPGETWTYTATIPATAGQYTNIGEVQGTSPTGQVVTDMNPSNHFGAAPGINIVKQTNGENADVGPGPTLLIGSMATFDYLVTNTGNVALANIIVTDDQGLTPVFVRGDINGNGLLDLGETWVYTATTLVTAGLYTNIGTAMGTSPDGRTVTDTNPSNHFGTSVIPPGPTASISGFVYEDLNRNGIFDAGDVGLGGITVMLVGTQFGPTNGDQVITFTAVTNEAGFYQFPLDDIFFGFFEVIQVMPAGFQTSAINVGSLGGVGVDFDAFTNRIGNVLIRDGDGGIQYNFGLFRENGIGVGFLSGTVHLDIHDNDGIFDGVDDMLMANVIIVLSGIDNEGNPVNFQTVTDTNGNYVFFNLRPGVYTITQIQPQGFLRGRQRLGSLGGNIGPNRFTNINLRAEDMGVAYNFANRLKPQCRVPFAQLRDRGFLHAGPPRQILLRHFPGLFNGQGSGNTQSANPAPAQNDPLVQKALAFQRQMGGQLDPIRNPRAYQILLRHGLID